MLPQGFEPQQIKNLLRSINAEEAFRRVIEELLDELSVFRERPITRAVKPYYLNSLQDNS